MSDVMPTIAVMPMTTPSTVNAERSLLARSVSSASAATSRSSSRFIYSRLNASMGSSRAARDAGERAEDSPTAAVMPMPSATDHGSSRAGSGVSAEMMRAIPAPSAMAARAAQRDSG